MTSTSTSDRHWTSSSRVYSLVGVIIPTNKPNPTREDFVRGFMEHFRDSREEAEATTQLYIDLGYFTPSDEQHVAV